MSTTAHIDLEQARSTDEESDIRSICFSDADEGSCYSTFYSTAGGSYDDIRFTDHEVDNGLVSRRDSCVSDCSVEVVILGVNGDGKVCLDGMIGDELKECRICHLSLGIGSNVIELGCDCKNDLAVAHSNCAERWFKIRGNRICEICNSTAENVNVVTELNLTQQPSVANATTVTIPPPSPAESVTRNFWQGHRFLNFLLACMVFAFVVSWLFHFNVHS